jgi:hypothetical protein
MEANYNTPGLPATTVPPKNEFAIWYILFSANSENK